MNFTHIKDDRAHMVDISSKAEVERRAVASGRIRLKQDTIEAIKSGTVEKGNVLQTARIAAVLAIKRTFEVIPMCHQIPVTGIDVDFEIGKEDIVATVDVKSIGKTGVEMEALHGVTVALLTVWDMVKSNEKDESGNYPDTMISDIRVLKKVKGAQETS